MKNLGLVFLCAFMLGACTSSYKAVSFYEFNGREFGEDILPVTVEIPKNLVIFKPQGGLASSVWLSLGDVKKRTATPPSDPIDSFFGIQLSRSLIYHLSQDYFQFTRGGKAENSIVIMKRELEQNGLQDVKIKRHNVAGFPVLQVEMRGAENTKVHRFYIGTKIATNTIQISFVGKSSDEKDDDEIWSSFITSIMDGH